MFVYGEADFLSIKQQVKKTLIVIVVIFLAFLITAVAFMLRQPQWMGAGFLIIGVCICIFILGIYGTPAIAYYRYVRDITEGKTREIKGKVIKLSEQPVYKDNKLFFYELWIIDDESEERVLLYDRNKGEPHIGLNQEYTFEIHENFIVNILN